VSFTILNLTPKTLYFIDIIAGGYMLKNKIDTLNNISVANVVCDPLYNSINVSFQPRCYSNDYTIKLNGITVFPTIINNSFTLSGLNVDTTANIYISCGYGDPGIYKISRTSVSSPIQYVDLSSSYDSITAKITPPYNIDPVGPYTILLDNNIISPQPIVQRNSFILTGLQSNSKYTVGISTGGSAYVYKDIHTIPSTPIRNLTLDSSFTAIYGTFMPSPYGQTYDILLSLNGITTNYSNVYDKPNGFKGFDISGLIVNTKYTVGVSTSGSEYVYKDINTSPSTPIRNLVLTPSYTTISGNFVPSIYGNIYSIFIGDTKYTGKTSFEEINERLTSFTIYGLSVFTNYNVGISTNGSIIIYKNTITLPCPPVSNLHLVADGKQAIDLSFVPYQYASYYTIYYNGIPSNLNPLLYDPCNNDYSQLKSNNGIVNYRIIGLNLNTLYNINVSTCITSNTTSSIMTFPASPITNLRTTGFYNEIKCEFTKSEDGTRDYTIYYNGNITHIDTSFTYFTITGLLVNTFYTLGISTSGSEIVYGNTYTSPADSITNLSLKSYYQTIDVSYTVSSHGTDYSFYLNDNMITAISTPYYISPIKTITILTSTVGTVSKQMFTIYNLEVNTNYSVGISVSGSGNVVAMAKTLYLPSAILVKQTPSILNGNVCFSIDYNNASSFTPSTTYNALDNANNVIQSNILYGGGTFTVSTSSIRKNTIYNIKIQSNDEGSPVFVNSNSLDCLYLSQPVLTDFIGNIDIYNNAAFILTNSITDYPNGTSFKANITQNGMTIPGSSIVSLVENSKFDKLKVYSSLNNNVFNFNTPYQIKLTASYTIPSYGIINSTESNQYDCIYLIPPVLSSPTIITPTTFKIPFTNTTAYPQGSMYHVSFYKDISMTAIITQPNIVYAPYTNITVDASQTYFTLTTINGAIYGNNQPYYIGIDVTSGITTSPVSKAVQCIYVPPPKLETPIPSLINGNISFSIKNTTIYPNSGTTFDSIIKDTNNTFINDKSNLPTDINGNIVFTDDTKQLRENTEYKLYLFAKYSNQTSYSGNITCIYLTAPTLTVKPSVYYDNNVNFMFLNTTVYPFLKMSFTANIKDENQQVLSYATAVSSSVDANGLMLTVYPQSSTPVFLKNKPYSVQLKAVYGADVLGFSQTGGISSEYSPFQMCILLSKPVLSNQTVNGNTAFIIPYSPVYPTGTAYTATITPSLGQPFTVDKSQPDGNIIITPQNRIIDNTLYSIQINASIYDASSGISDPVNYIYLPTPVLTTYLPNIDARGNIMFNITNNTPNYIADTSFTIKLFDDTTGNEITTIIPSVIKDGNFNNFIVTSSRSSPAAFKYNTQYRMNINAIYRLIATAYSGNIICVSLTAPVLVRSNIFVSPRFYKIGFTSGSNYPSYPPSTTFTASIIPSLSTTVTAYNNIFTITSNEITDIDTSTAYSVSVNATLNSNTSLYSSPVSCRIVPYPVFTSFDVPTTTFNGSNTYFKIKNATLYSYITPLFSGNILLNSNSSLIQALSGLAQDMSGNITINLTNTNPSILQNTLYKINLSASYYGNISETNTITCINLSTPVLLTGSGYGSLDPYGNIQFNMKQTVSYPVDISYNGTITNITTTPSTIISSSLYSVSNDSTGNIIFASTPNNNIFEYFNNYKFTVNTLYKYTINGVSNSYLSAISNDISLIYLAPPTNLAYNVSGGYFTFTPPIVNPTYPLATLGYISYKNNNSITSFNLGSIAAFVPTLNSNTTTIQNTGLQTGSYIVSSYNGSINAYNAFTSSGFSIANTATYTTTDGQTSIAGAWIQIKLPIPVKITNFTVGSSTSFTEIKIVASNNGSSWTEYATYSSRTVTITPTGTFASYTLGSKIFYKFTATGGLITANNSIVGNVLIVGGGGSGGTMSSGYGNEGQGGGGAGQTANGYINFTSTNSCSNITIGNGGNQGGNNNKHGNNSSILVGGITYTAIGGGYGINGASGRDSGNGNNGGSGGGGCGRGGGTNGDPGTATAKAPDANFTYSGYNGGAGGWNAGGGGGGGSTGVGGSSSNPLTVNNGGAAGNGGAGLSWIDGNTYAGGGGGGGGLQYASTNTGKGGNGGNGGGGKGYNNRDGETAAVSGTANKGGGGGGGGTDSGVSIQNGASGGSGVVVFGFDTALLNTYNVDYPNTNTYQYYRFIGTSPSSGTFKNINFTGTPDNTTPAFAISTSAGDKIKIYASYTRGDFNSSNTITI